MAIAESQVGRLVSGNRYSSLMVASAESLIRCGGLDVRDWRQHCIPDSVGEIPPEAAWLGMLPIALFYHEDESWLNRQLTEAIALWPQSNSRESDLMNLMTIGWAIARILTHKVEAATTIPYILKRLNNGEKISEQLENKLRTMHLLLSQSASLETAMVELKISNDPNSTAIATALYCFLSTPENFPISVQRAAQTRSQPHLTTLLAGALSGAYNSCVGMPMNWQLSDSIAIDRRNILEQITVADRLFATWSGLYDADKTLADRPLNPLMAAIAQPVRESLDAS